MNKTSIFTMAIIAPLAGIVVACGSADPEPASRSNEEAIITHSCMESCNVKYTSCASTADPCNCWDQYVSCTKRCGSKPGFDQPEGCGVDAAAPANPDPGNGSCDGFYCLCGAPNACFSTCTACIAACNGHPPVPNPCY